VDRTEAIELQRRNLDAFVRMLAAGSDDSVLFEREGVLAAIVPACPERSVINSVVYRDPDGLGAAREELARAYEEAGVRAWTVWVPEDEREAADLLEGAGHRLDATPLAMTLDLARLPEPEEEELDWDDRAAVANVARVNDNAYGFGTPTFGAALARLPGELPLRFYQARVEGEPACVVATLDQGEDCGIYLVATLKDHRGRGLARRLMHLALAEARDRGRRTSTLQATKLGAPVYERLGYETFGALEMWEHRRPSDSA
jgi:GNAT superfamily N-acetyltransferase